MLSTHDVTIRPLGPSGAHDAAFGYRTRKARRLLIVEQARCTAASPMLRGSQTLVRRGLQHSSAGRWSALVAGGAAARVSDASFVEECRAQYLANGWCHIPNFIGKERCAELRNEADALLESDAAFASTDDHTVYQQERDERLPLDHPRNRLMKSTKRIVDYEHVPQESSLRELYSAPELRSFVQAVVGVPELHLSACPYNAAMYNGYYDSDGLDWHFDSSEFGVNLVLQNPTDGGKFEYHSLTRSEEDLWSYDAVTKVLAEADASAEGAATSAETVEGLAPGSLVFFAGRLSLHRVSPVLNPDVQSGAVPPDSRGASLRAGARLNAANQRYPHV